MITRKFTACKETEIAYGIMKKMEEKNLTITEARRVADRLVEMLRENRVQSNNNTPLSVFSSLEELTIHPQNAF